MLHRLFTTVTLLCILGLVVSERSIQTYTGRSGDIIIQTTDVIDNSALLLHGGAFQNTQLTSIEDVRIADLFAHIMGTQPFNVHANREGFPKGGLFNKARAAIIVTLDAVAPEDLSLGAGFQSVPVTSKSFPINTHTMSSNIATGVSPAIHGIVAETWMMGNKQKTTATGAALSANLADILSQEWQGDSLLVSASASATHASVFAVNKQLKSTNAYALSVNNNAFESIYADGESAFSLSAKKLEKIVESTGFAEFVGSDVSSLNADNEAVSSLLAELAFVYNFINTLERDSVFSSYVSDSAPDFYAFSFSSLKSMQTEYGKSSDSYRVAIALVERAVQNLVNKVDEWYQGRAATAVVALNSHARVSPALVQSVLDTVQEHLHSPQDYLAHFPALYVKTQDAHLACNKLRSAVESLSVSVHCLAPSPRHVLVGDDPFNNNSNNTVPTQAPLNVPAFWVIIGITIVMLAFIIGGVVLLCAAGVEASKDSLLFRSTGRHHHQN